jgi:3-isopropylmalate dehydrogenase
MNFKITLLPGDGIGPEVVGEAVRVLETIASKYKHTFDFQERLMGGCSIDKYGSSLTDETLADCRIATPCCWARSADRNGTTPKPKTAPSAAAGPAQRTGRVRQPAPGQGPPGADRWSPLKPEKLQGRGYSRHPRTDRRPVLRLARKAATSKTAANAPWIRSNITITKSAA